jgi:hypothetical protein
MINANYYDESTKTMNYFTESNYTLDKMNEDILKDFYNAVKWLFNKHYDEYRELESNTINPAQQNAFLPLRIYRVKRNGHYKLIRIYHRFWGSCLITEEDY